MTKAFMDYVASRADGQKEYQDIKQHGQHSKYFKSAKETRGRIKNSSTNLDLIKQKKKQKMPHDENQRWAKKGIIQNKTKTQTSAFEQEKGLLEQRNQDIVKTKSSILDLENQLKQQKAYLSKRSRIQSV